MSILKPSCFPIQLMRSTKYTQQKIFNLVCFSAAARQTRDADQNRRREELQRRIEETRQKLQNVRNPSSSFFLRPIFIFLLHWDYSFFCINVILTDNDTDSCKDSHCFNDNHDETIGQTGANRKELWWWWGVGNVLRRLECRLLTNYSFHSWTRHYFSGRPILRHTMITPLLVQQWQGVTWMTQCERLPDWCDAAAWRGDKTRVCHEPTLPTISTANSLSNMSVCMTWHLQCVAVQSERMADWCDTAWHGDKPTEGGSVAHQATLSAFSICNLLPRHANYLDLTNRDFTPYFTLTVRLKIPNKSCPTPYTSQPLSSFQFVNVPTTYLPTTPVPCAPYTSFPPVGTRP